jgi:hypothetical protein
MYSWYIILEARRQYDSEVHPSEWADQQGHNESKDTPRALYCYATSSSPSVVHGDTAHTTCQITRHTPASLISLGIQAASAVIKTFRFNKSLIAFITALAACWKKSTSMLLGIAWLGDSWSPTSIAMEVISESEEQKSHFQTYSSVSPDFFSIVSRALALYISRDYGVMRPMRMSMQ